MSSIMAQLSMNGEIMYPNRYVCSVLDEMRKQLKTLEGVNEDILVLHYVRITKLMIEEAQTMVNRMEASLEDYGDIKGMLKERDSLYKEIKKLKEERNKLKEELK